MRTMKWHSSRRILAAIGVAAVIAMGLIVAPTSAPAHADEAADHTLNPPPSSEIDVPSSTSVPAPPVILTPANGTILPAAGLTYSGTGEAGAFANLYLDAALMATVLVPSSGNWSFTPTVPPSNGPHILDVTLSNSAGSASLPVSVNFTINNSAPAPPLIASPANGTRSTTRCPRSVAPAALSVAWCMST